MHEPTFVKEDRQTDKRMKPIKEDSKRLKDIKTDRQMREMKTKIGQRKRDRKKRNKIVLMNR